MSGSVVFAGSIAQRPANAGHTWVFLQYLLGFKRLGLDVLFLDRLEDVMCTDTGGTACELDRSVNVAYFLDVMRRSGLEDSFSLDCNRGRSQLGLSKSTVLERVAKADVLINVMGFVDDPDVLSAARRRVFLDIDPGFGQMWQTLGLCQIFSGHDQYVTVGLNVGQPDCLIPNCGLNWLTTLPPVVLDLWPVQQADPSAAFSSIATWRGPFGPVDYQGERFGLRVHEFRKFFELPRRTQASFELALDIDPSDAADLERLRAEQWKLISPLQAAGSLNAYQLTIQRAKAEFMVAKEMYVKAKSGWFSDRSACYLASGKPVLAQDTCLKAFLPTGRGLLLFSDLEQAVCGVQDIETNYAQHAEAARALAEAHFCSSVVLPQLLEKLSL